MRVDVALIPASNPAKDMSDRTAVVIDLLRATTTIVTAFSNGCTEIIPVQDANEAGTLARRLGGNCLLGGERMGHRIDGFNLGNSPLEYSAEAVGGHKVVMTTTNGTKAIKSASGARKVVLASLANLQPVAAFLAAEGRDIVIFCSGNDGGFSLEDTVCAGALVEALDPEGYNDAAKTARILYKHAARKLAAFIGQGEHGSYLKSIGLGDDVIFCTRMNWTDVIPVYQEGRVTAIRAASAVEEAFKDQPHEK